MVPFVCISINLKMTLTENRLISEQVLRVVKKACLIDQCKSSVKTRHEIAQKYFPMQRVV